MICGRLHEHKRIYSQWREANGVRPSALNAVQSDVKQERRPSTPMRSDRAPSAAPTDRVAGVVLAEVEERSVARQPSFELGLGPVVTIDEDPGCSCKRRAIVDFDSLNISSAWPSKISLRSAAAKGRASDQSIVKAMMLSPRRKSIWVLPPEPTTMYCLPSTSYEDGGALTPAPAWNCQSCLPVAEL